MNVEAHRAKAESIERSLARCTTADYETVVEGCMLAGTHWFNIALHRTGLLPDDQDALHAEFLTVAQRRRVGVALPAALAALDVIETLRTRYVRGDLDGGEQAAEHALAGLAALRHAALHSPSRSLR